ncbi:MAG: hypothetical protein QXI24_04000 [Acidilobaceae archaeon]
MSVEIKKARYIVVAMVIALIIGGFLDTLVVKPSLILEYLVIFLLEYLELLYHLSYSSL